MKSTIIRTFIILLSIIIVNGIAYCQEEKSGDKKKKKEKQQKEQVVTPIIEKSLERPLSIGYQPIDDYVTKSFDVYDYTFDTDQEFHKLDSLFRVCEEDSTRMTENTALRMNRSMIALKRRCGESHKNASALLGTGSFLINAATGLTPKTKSVKAVKNIKMSTKALNICRKKTQEQIKRSAAYSRKINALYK